MQGNEQPNGPQSTSEPSGSIYTVERPSENTYMLYAQELSRFPAYLDAELPSALRNRPSRSSDSKIPRLTYGFLIPGGIDHVVRIVQERDVRLAKPPHRKRHGSFVLGVKLSLAHHIQVILQWPMVLFKESKHWNYDLGRNYVLDKDGADTGLVLSFYDHTNLPDSEDRCMFLLSEFCFPKVVKVVETILDLPEAAEPRWFFLQSGKCPPDFDINRCYRHEYPPQPVVSGDDAYDAQMQAGTPVS